MNVKSDYLNNWIIINKLLIYLVKLQVRSLVYFAFIIIIIIILRIYDI